MPEGEGTIIPEEEPGTGTTTGEGEGATTPVEEEPTLSPEEITTLKDILREDPSSKNILGLWKKMQTLESKMKKLETMFQIGTREPEEIFNEATEDTDIIYFQIQTDEN